MIVTKEFVHISYLVFCFIWLLAIACGVDSDFKFNFGVKMFWIGMAWLAIGLFLTT